MKKITIFSILFFIIDLVVKTIVKNSIELYSSIKIIPNFFNLTYVQNTGAAFSILENNRILFIIVALIAIFFIYSYLNKINCFSKFNIICYSLLIGGIIGNLFDRIVYGYVIDYLSFNIFGYNFPVFNLADSYIVIAVFLILLKEIKEAYGKVSSR